MIGIHYVILIVIVSIIIVIIVIIVVIVSGRRSIPEDKIMSEWVSANTGKGNGNSNSNDKLAGGNSRVKNGEVTMNPSSIYGPRRPKYQPSSMDADMSDPTMIAEVRDSSEMSGTSSRLVSRPGSEGQIMPINYREDAQV